MNIEYLTSVQDLLKHFMFKLERKVLLSYTKKVGCKVLSEALTKACLIFEKHRNAESFVNFYL